MIVALAALCGLGLMLLARAGVRVRWRGRATREELTLEGDVRVHCGGVHRVVGVAAVALGSAVGAWLFVVRLLIR